MLLSPLVERAIELAAEWHDRTYRKSRWREVPFDRPEGEDRPRIPVMAHVTAVALTVQRAGWPDEAVAAAFLHDALEDANQFGDHMAEETLVALMGEEVALIVRGVTEPKFDASGEHLPWRVRKDAYLDCLRQSPVESVAVSLADKLHNAWTMNQTMGSGQDLFTAGPGRKALSAGPEDQRWFFRAVLAVSEAHDDSRLAPMRARLIEEVEKFERLTG